MEWKRHHKLFTLNIIILLGFVLLLHSKLSKNYFYTYSSINILNAKPLSFSDGNKVIDSLDEFVPTRYGSTTIQYDGTKENKKLGICFAGGIREFELSGVTLVRRVLDYYDPLVTFFNVPLDEHTHKLSILLKTNTNIAVNIVTQVPLNGSGTPEALMDTNGSPNGLQGLLLYFQLNEGCGDLVLGYEKMHNMKFKWILRARPDSFWNHNSLPVSNFVANQYIIPHGSVFGGLNDRLAIADRNISLLAFKRLSSLDMVYNAGYRMFNSEKTLHAQIKLMGIAVMKKHFPFCVLTRRVYNWPMKIRGTPVGSLTSKGYLNGIKCRPCQPIARGKLSKQFLGVLNDSWGAPGNKEGVDLCNATSTWDNNWEKIFDSQVNSEAVEIRRHIKARGYRTCLKENMLLRKKAEFFNGPPISVVCIVGEWGPFQPLGPPDQSWYVLTRGLNRNSIVYSFGIGRSLAWERDLISATEAEVHAFDCTPDGYSWAVDSKAYENKRLILHNKCLGSVNGWKIFHNLAVDNGTEGEAYVSMKYPLKGYKFVGEPQRTEIMTLASFMEDLKHDVVDLVRVNVGEEFFSIFSKDWAENIDKVPVCQLVLDFGLRRFIDPENLRAKTLQIFEDKGFSLVKCFGDFRTEKCYFLSSSFCNF